MNCECMNWAMIPKDGFTLQHHHYECSKYKTEKFPRLFYYEEAENAWCLAPDKVEHIINTDNLDDGDSADIQFKRVDLTDEEIDTLSEV